MKCKKILKITAVIVAVLFSFGILLGVLLSCKKSNETVSVFADEILATEDDIVSVATYIKYEYYSFNSPVYPIILYGYKGSSKKSVTINNRSDVLTVSTEFRVTDYTDGHSETNVLANNSVSYSIIVDGDGVRLFPEGESLPFSRRKLDGQNSTDKKPLMVFLSYDISYDMSYSEIRKDGYDEGYSDGWNDCQDIVNDREDTIDGLRDTIEYLTNQIPISYENGYNAGYHDGWGLGQESGYDTGYDSGYNSGYSDGCDEGYDEWYDNGFDDGREEGFDDGYSQGFDVGWDEGEAYGYDKGYDDGDEHGHTYGYGEGWEIGYSEGKSIGYDVGHSEGFNLGQTVQFTNPLNFFIEPVHRFMNTQFFGEITYATIFNIVLFIAVALIFIKMFAGG